MRLKKNLKLRKIGNTYMIVDAGNDNVNMVDVYTMNEAAALLWEVYETKEFTIHDMVNTMIREYEVTKEIAQRDIEALLNEWESMGLMIR